MEYAISLVEMVRSCFHVYFLEAMVGTLTMILVLSTLIIRWTLLDIAMLLLELAWIDWLQVLMDTERWW